jgi:endonuclease/exonuclease/phosphatase (EEP) superfamily protein YafD
MVRIFFGLCALGLILGVTLGFLGAFHPAFDTIAHFRWHFALAMIFLALLGVMLRVPRVPILLIFFAAIGVWQSSAGNRMDLSKNTNPSASRSISTSGDSTQKITLLQYNLRFNNPLKDGVLAMIRDTNADILTLNETSREWTPALETLKTDYPFLFHCPEWQAIGGGMIFSKFPLRADNNYCHSYAALGLTEVQIETQWITIGTVHMRWPWPASGPEQLIAIEPALIKIDSNAVIAGDFNATTWSHAVRKFADLSGMNVAKGYGGTWIYKWLPTSLAPFFGLPIDHVMAKGIVKIVSVKSLPAIGSDHLPLLAEISINPS